MIFNLVLPGWWLRLERSEFHLPELENLDFRVRRRAPPDDISSKGEDEDVVVAGDQDLDAFVEQARFGEISLLRCLNSGAHVDVHEPVDI